MRKQIICRRLEPEDAESFHALRLEGFRLEPRAFRFAPEDEADLPLSAVVSRLQNDYVVGACDARTLVGVGGLARGRDVRTQHKALIYGMYLRARASFLRALGFSRLWRRGAFGENR